LNTKGMVLPLERVRRLENFGHSFSSPAFVYSPTNTEQVEEMFHTARQKGVHITMRGAGRSYGDAATNTGEIVLDMQRMDRILSWDSQSGIVDAEPGVTIAQLWQNTLSDGWWIPVVPGTMAPTLGGCLASNVHGKNNWKEGPIGEHVLSFSALLPSGEVVKCSPTQNEELFYSMIGGMGILGVIISIRMQMKRIYSGDLEVFAWAEPDLRHALEGLDEAKDNDYVVRWVDGTPNGKKLGRGQLHSARYLDEGEDPPQAHTLRPEHQILPDTILGLIPKAVTWRFMRPVMNNLGVWVGNTGKYLINRTIGHRKRYRQSLVAFNFLLDYVPDWERAYGPGGLIQYQSFLPKETALDAYAEMLALCKRRGLPSFLGVIKRHRPDNFLLTHSLDGYSLAMDFLVSDRNRSRLSRLTSDLNKIVLLAGGRFYFAKDSTLNPDEIMQYLGEKTVSDFRKLKARVDPDGLLQSDLYRRCFSNESPR
jgi:decaprenylphospho-beta-D-ribofuranose 2-oxidase